MNTRPQVSIIIPTLYRNTELLQQCLKSISNMTFPGTYEVIVVVNRPLDKTEELHFPGVHTYWITLSRNLGFAGAANRGIEASLGELVVLLNDDVEVTKNWLTELVSEHKRSRADMVASNIYLADRNTLDSQGFSFAWRGKAEALKEGASSLQLYRDHWLKNRNLFQNKDKRFWKEPFGPDAAACLYTRVLLTSVGIFREDFFAYLEDVELALRARGAGYRCAFAEKAVVYHHKHATSKTLPRFKAKQDLVNWWRIVIQYPAAAWMGFAITIIIERLRNITGMMRSITRNQ